MCCNRPFLFEGKYSLSWQHIDLLSTTIPLLLIIVFLTFFSFLRIVIIKFIVYIYIERSCADSLENAWYMSTLAFLDFCGISIQTMLYNMTGGTRLNRPSLCCRPRVSLGNPALFFLREKKSQTRSTNGLVTYRQSVSMQCQSVTKKEKENVPLPTQFSLQVNS